VVDTPGVRDVRDALVVVRWRARGGVWRWARADAGLLAEQLWRAGPVRVGAQYRNRPDRHGLYFWPRTGGHVRFESARQVAALMRLDFEGREDCVGFRPVRLRFRRGAVTVGHDPDFLAVQVGGDQVLYDVAPDGPATEKVMARWAETTRVCGLVGWRHQVLCPPSGVWAANLEVLGPARLPRCHPPDRLAARLRDVFAAGRSIGQGAAAAGGRYPALVLPHVKHLIWHRRLAADLHVLLDFDTVATTVGEGGPCCG